MQWLARFIVAGALVVALLFTMSVSETPSSIHHQTDPQLLSALERQRALYIQLIGMFRQDVPLSSINPQFMDPDRTVDTGRWQQYRQLFSLLSLDGGMRGWGKGGIMFISSVFPMAEGSSTKGYVYHPQNPLPLYADLDKAAAQLSPNTVAYHKIDDDWYLFYLKSN
ncbi:hypothetical protein [Shewanella dokdonensis]|uniref:Uncharacterized protein n=1 Tax=Shewanella dokdonensis TaxID=712036 RepID=A0ABX8DF29_9GAMM|nr:hypothetical protein [Shewanella dokdonensis]MCL1074884.1 hypothetical protein [Shewanella dokdonensis]QVK23342.1 hypothetical protein KHX94_00510 [Shewanella dokdonensis]